MNLRKIAWIVGAVVVALIIFRITMRITGSGRMQTEKIVPVVTELPRIGIIEDKITLAGDVQANTQVSVRPRITGRVEEIYVEEGDYVSKGEGLMSFVAGIEPDNELFDDMVTTAPISGLVGMKLVKVGEQVMSSVGTISPVFVLYDINTMKIYADVPEKYYSQIKRRLPCEIAVDALPGKKFGGSIYNIRPVIDPITRTTQVEIRIPNRSRIIKPGMFAKVSIILGKKTNAMVVPYDAVLGDEVKYVYIDDGGKASRRDVATGIIQDNEVEIIKGLLKTDKVLTVGQRVVKDGTQIRETSK